MAAVALTNALRQSYETLFNSCVVNPARVAVVEDLVKSLVRNQPRYRAAGNLAGVPWFFFVKLDGYPGKRTSEAFRAVTGNYLPGDPRNRA